MTDGCVKLGDEDIPDDWSCDVIGGADGTIGGTIGAVAGGFDTETAEAGGCD